MTEAERWLSAEEIAAHLGVSKETIYRWLEKKDEKRRIPVNRIRRLWKFKASEVDEWMKSNGAADTEYSHRV